MAEQHCRDQSIDVSVGMSVAIKGLELGTLFRVDTLGVVSGYHVSDNWFRLKCVEELTRFVGVSVASSKCVGSGCGGFSDGSGWQKHAGHRLPFVGV